MGDRESSSSSGANTIKKKKDDKYKKRDPRFWDNIKKQIASMTEEEKLDFISEKYNELYNEHRNLNTLVQAREKQITVLQKDLDREQADLTKAILAKGHLESLCRELQKQNKAIKEENIARVKEEEERRREVANTFTERLNALTNLITESKDKSNKVKEENQSMTDKLSELYEQYQKREDYLDNMAKQLDLQKKLAESAIKKNQVEYEAQRHNWLEEKKALENNLQIGENQIKILQAHVNLYKRQYETFEATMTKSKKVFEGFKEEKSKMHKQVTSLESERDEWRSRWQNSAKSLITLSEQHTQITNELRAAESKIALLQSSEPKATEKKITLLQNLCRQLQFERGVFLQQLKEHNIEPKHPVLENQEPEEASSEIQQAPQQSVSLNQEIQALKIELAETDSGNLAKLNGSNEMPSSPDSKETIVSLEPETICQEVAKECESKGETRHESDVALP
ncbi:beta-taxilin isoform X2 [Cylas formicarius]|nr:beta-taxilin isoform X2 [Cylas formicarius]XP_060537145.1 beta-taxilin isoform X2 [Cylas formicarius]XP_060537146.1 beta-taxilin isoform X2 [Cylas formicarius]